VDSSPGWIGDWSPGIGDPTVVGWVTVALYVGASLLCFRAARALVASLPATAPEDRAGRRPVSLGPALARALVGASRPLLALPPRARTRALWLGLAIVLLLLGVNKQLDLQTAIIEVGRRLARAQGWYGSRRRVEVAFVGALAASGLAVLRVVFLLVRREPPGARAVLVGATLLVAFVVFRAACFEHLDRMFGLELSDSPWNAAPELGGICFIILGTYRVLRSPQAPGAR
jgi:hypothetical protein